MSVLCKKLSNIVSNSMLRGRNFFFDQLDCLCVMCSAISVGPRGMVQPIAAAVLKTFIMTNKDGDIHTCTMLAANSEGK